MSASGDVDNNKDEEDIFNKDLQFPITDNHSGGTVSETINHSLSVNATDSTSDMNQGPVMSSLDINKITSENKLKNTSPKSDEVLEKNITNDEPSEDAAKSVDINGRKMNTPDTKFDLINKTITDKENMGSEDNELRSDNLSMSCNQTASVDAASEEKLLAELADNIEITNLVSTATTNFIENEVKIPKAGSENSSEKQEILVKEEQRVINNVDNTPDTSNVIDQEITISALENPNVTFENDTIDDGSSKSADASEVDRSNKGNCNKEFVEAVTVFSDIGNVTSTENTVAEDNKITANNDLTPCDCDVREIPTDNVELGESEVNVIGIPKNVVSVTVLPPENKEISEIDESETVDNSLSEMAVMEKATVPGTSKSNSNSMVTDSNEAVDSQEVVSIIDKDIISKEAVTDGNNELRFDNVSMSDNQVESANSSAEEKLLYESDDNMMETVSSASVPLPVHTLETLDSIEDKISDKELAENIGIVSSQLHEMSESESESSTKSTKQPDVIMDKLEEEELMKDNHTNVIDTTMEIDKIGKSIKAVLETGKSSTSMSTDKNIENVTNFYKIDGVEGIKEANVDSTTLQTVNKNTLQEQTNQGENTRADVTMHIDNSTKMISSVDSPIHIKTIHSLHKPDVMLEIPTQELIDIDDVLDSPNDCSFTDDFPNNSENAKSTESNNQVNEDIHMLESICDTTNETNDIKNLEEKSAVEVKTSSNKVPEIEDAQCSTSGSYKLNEDASDDLPEVSDSLGLLAESQRVRDDDDDEDDGAEEDDDSDHDESSNQMLTAEQSEDSNAPPSDAEAMKFEESREDAEDKVSNESEGDIDEVIEEQVNKNAFDGLEIEEHEFGDEADVVVEEENVLCEEDSPKGDEGHDTADTQLLPNTSAEIMPEAITPVNADISKTVDEKDDAVATKANEVREEGEDGRKDEQENYDAVLLADESPKDDDVIEQTNVIPTYNVLDSDSEDDVPPKTDHDKKGEKTDVTVEGSSQKTSEVSTKDKTKKSDVPADGVKTSNNINETVVSIVDLQESSDEDGVTTINIPKGIEVKSTSATAGCTPEILKTPGKTVISGVQKVTPVKSVPRLNTGEVTIKTSTGPEQALLIPEAQVSTESGPAVKSEPVYSIDSDEEEAKEKADSTKTNRKTKKCINNSCSSGAKALKAADVETATYYDASRKRRPLVCQPCADAVLAWKQRLITGIKDMIPLTKLDMSSKCQYSVEILDSESEDEEPPPKEDQVKEAIGEDAAKFLEQHLVDVFNETWTKYCLEDRLQDTENELNAEMESLEVKRKEIDDMLSECQRMTDKLRADLYATFQARIQEEPPLVIIDKPDFRYIGPESFCPNLPDDKNRVDAKRKLSSNNNPPAKRPAVIPLGYAPLNDPRLKVQESKGTATNSDDDKDVAVVKLSAESPPPDLPPPGELTRAPLRVEMPVYAMKNAFGPWLKAKITEILPKGTSPSNFTACRVQFHHVSKNNTKILPGRCIAYADPPEVRMTIGTRVVALFKGSRFPCYSSGVIAEAPTPVNNYRYLVFFDDGYAQYVNHSFIRLVCECSPLVWDEVHPFSREFVKEYLMAYPERPMVRLHKGQNFKTEWNGKWLASRVAKVDASLVEVEFLADGRREWIYRGSTRLAPLYMELKAAERQRPRLLLGSRGRQQPRIDMPYVEYTRSEEQGANKVLETLPNNTGMTIQQQNEELRRQRAVAKKSTTVPAVTPGQTGPKVNADHPDNITSRVVYYTPKSAVKPYKLVPHTCSPQCKRTDVLSLKELRTYNPLAKPLLSGWERQILRFKGQKEVMYRAPCGRRLRNMKELHRYLRATDSELPVDLFDFYFGTHCLAEFQIYKYLTGKKDLSHGKENVPVPCVNYYDESLPEFCSYNTERTPTSGVPLNLDPEFLCGCDCTDDCEDKTKCACWKMTLEGAHTIGLEGPNIGYEYKRLPEPLASGIYECNSRCKCKQTCLNRVAQHPLQLKLQVFKTLRRGWGIRALNDVPKGAFLCVYAGNLLTDATANLDGLNEGDEYLAELDYIEVVEQMKEGYEEDVPEADKKLDKKSSDKAKGEDSREESSASSEEDEGNSKYDEQDDDFRPGHIGSEVTQFRKNLRKRSRDEEKGSEGKDKDKDAKDKNADDVCITISDDEEVREPSSFAAQSGMGGNEFVSKYKSVRAYFGEDEACYIMDAKVQGNIGRYLNHSCSPNVFVQNVFVDTHDPRFPWVAFFALSHIKAGTELTWNYNYDVGSVPGKVLYCYCQAPNCRGRLL